MMPRRIIILQLGVLFHYIGIEKVEALLISQGTCVIHQPLGSHVSEYSYAYKSKTYEMYQVDCKDTPLFLRTSWGRPINSLTY